MEMMKFYLIIITIISLDSFNIFPQDNVKVESTLWDMIDSVDNIKENTAKDGQKFVISQLLVKTQKLFDIITNSINYLRKNSDTQEYKFGNINLMKSSRGDTIIRIQLTIYRPYYDFKSIKLNIGYFKFNGTSFFVHTIRGEGGLERIDELFEKTKNTIEIINKENESFGFSDFPIRVYRYSNNEFHFIKTLNGY